MMLIHDYQPEPNPLLAELSHYVSETDTVAVRDRLSEIQQRIDCFNKTTRAS
jgi:hypothetical protein